MRLGLVSCVLAVAGTVAVLPGCVPIVVPPPDQNGAQPGPGGGDQSGVYEAPLAEDPNRTVTVTINGAVIGPADQNGQAWDGPGLEPDMVNLFAGLVVKAFPVGQVPVLGELVGSFSGDLANSMFATFEPPDPKGTVAVFGGAADGSAYELFKNQDSYTPMWEASIAMVSIHSSAVSVSLMDADMAFDDPIADVVIDEQTMLAAEEAGGTFAIDTSMTTGGMVQRLFVTVSPY